MTRVMLRGAQVITMSSNRPDAESIDILIDGDQIADIGADLSDDGAEIIDCTGRIVMPGLVNAHLHTWQTGLRTLGADWTLSDYLGHSHGTIAKHYSPEDIRIATLAGALGQINSGTTTIADWCHNTKSPDHSDAAIEGLATSGIRAVFLHGTPYSTSTAHPIHEIDRLLDGSIRSHELLSLGMAIRGPQLSPPDIAVADFRAAGERGLVVSMHQSGGEARSGWDAVYSADLIGPRTNIAHGAGLSDDWVKRLTDAGATFTATPENELGQGHGAPITARLLPIGAAPSLGTDTDCVVAGDLLTSARIALAHQRGLDHDRQRRSTGVFSFDQTVTSKQALEWATTEGARALGLADRVGRIEPGMQADLIVIDARALNLWPAHDPVAAALHSSFGNIEAVLIAGQWRKRDHNLVDSNVENVKTELARSAERLVRKFRTPGILGGLRQKAVRKVVQRRMIRELSTD
ncbi:amidohydrolase family protein [Nocardia sp. NPDC052112]|uniref:amidohydrolase family protein n=1 Tax=Nocardia sp. NPDC052112 TaxID=3155646 RepID=UPI00342B2BDE